MSLGLPETMGINRLIPFPTTMHPFIFAGQDRFA